MGQRDSRSAVFLCQPHRELWRPPSQSRGTSEPQKPRKAEGASHMAYSYLLVVEYGAWSSALYTRYFVKSSQRPKGVGIVSVISILQMRKLRQREVK